MNDAAQMRFTLISQLLSRGLQASLAVREAEEAMRYVMFGGAGAQQAANQAADRVSRQAQESLKQMICSQPTI